MQRPHTWTGLARAYVTTFRIVVVSICFALATVGWIAHISWLLAAAGTVGVGELLECTYYLVVLDWGERTRRI